MSDANRPRPPKGGRSNTRDKMFDLYEEPLPPPPRPLQNLRDPFEDPPRLHPRSARRPTVATIARAQRPEFVLGEEPPEYAPPRGSLIESAASLRQAQALTERLYARARPAGYPYPPRPSLPELVHARPWLLALVCAACIVIVLLLSPAPQVFIHARSNTAIWSSSPASQAPAAPEAPPGQHSILGAPTISAEVIDRVLASYGSPAAGTGAVWVALGQQYGIDPAFALAFFIHESSAGTNPGWAGIKPDGNTTHNIGNIICAGYRTCFGRFRDYASWEEGIEDWYRLISREYVGDRGISTIEQIIPIYAPAFENNVPAYVQGVLTMVDGWRRDGGGQ